MNNQQQPVLIEFFDDEIEPPSFPFLTKRETSTTPEDEVAAATADLFSSLETAMAVDEEDEEEEAVEDDAEFEMPSSGSAPGGQNNSTIASDSVDKGRGRSRQRSVSRKPGSGAGASAARAPEAALKPAVPSVKPPSKPPTGKKSTKGVVDHTYRDFSGIPKDPSDKPLDDLELSELSFSQKLHKILSTKEHADCISWMPHGRAFRILIPKVFETKVAPIFFDHSRYSTFLRQLNNHGFKHITRGTDRNCYYHEAFLRDLPHLCKFMPRPKNARRLAPDAVNEPNFYRISEAFPLPDVSTESFVPAGESNLGHGEDPDSEPAPKPPSEGIDNTMFSNNTISREEAVSHAASLQHALNMQQVQDALDREKSIQILLGHMAAGSLPFSDLNHQLKPNAQNFGQPQAVAFPVRARIDNHVSSHDISATFAPFASLFGPGANGLLPKANLQSSPQMNPFGTVAMAQQSSAPTGQHMNMNLAPHLLGSPMMSLGL